MRTFICIPNEWTNLSAPSAPVTSLTGFNTSSTGLSISWQPPPFDDQNGIIRGYTVSYGITGEDLTSFVTETTNETQIPLTGLEKFTVYNVTVNAFTIAAGPSDTIQIQTDSDSEYYPFCVHWDNRFFLCALSGAILLKPLSAANDGYTITCVNR